MITLKNILMTVRCSTTSMWQRISAVLGGIAVHLSTVVDSHTGFAFTALDTILKDLTNTQVGQQPQLQPIRIDDSNRPHTKA